MYNSEKGYKEIREKVLTQSWQYIYENFHKFNESNKIKIALALSCKTIPTALEHSGDGLKQVVNIINNYDTRTDTDTDSCLRPASLGERSLESSS